MACACVEKLQSLCLRVKLACRHRSRVGRSKSRSIKISDPFDFKHISDVPDGLSQDEVNVLREKAAASRMVAIEDQPTSRPPSRPTTTGSAVVFNSNSEFGGGGGGGFGGSPRPQKSRTGYRGLASSTGRGLSYSALTESRPSITRSFAAMDDSAGSLSPASSLTTRSSLSSAAERKEVRGRSI